jgi:hypothetical protein
MSGSVRSAHGSTLQRVGAVVFALGLSALFIGGALREMNRAQAQPALPKPGEGRPPVWDTLTPQERFEYKQGMLNKGLRQSLQEAGFIGKDVQDPILNFARKREDACQELRDKAMKLDTFLQEQANDIDVQLALADFRESVAHEKKERDADLKELNAAIHYSKKPRLAAFLVTRGITSDDYSYLLNRALYIKTEIPNALIYN